MALYDGLPLNTPTKVGGDGSTFEVWATRTQNGGTVENRLIGAAATAAANQATITNGIANALAQLRTMQTQAAAFQAKPNYAANNLANLNDLLAANKVMAAAIGTIATDLIFLVRQLSGQFDGST